MPEIHDYDEPSSRPSTNRPVKRALQMMRSEPLITSISLISFAIIMTITSFIFVEIVSDSKTQKLSDSGSAILDIVAAPLLIVSSLMLYTVLQRMLRQRRYRVRISLTGQPGAGKTVFSVLLYHLISSYPPQGVEFTGETESVIKTFRALKGFDLGNWPPATSPDGVSVAKGELSAHSGRHTYEISVSDTAGEYWASLNENKFSSHPYWTLVASSDALVHVISVPELRERDGLIEDDTLDLQMAAQLMKIGRRRAGRRIPLLVVFSKFDGAAVQFLSDDELMFRQFNSDGLVGNKKVCDQKILEAVALLDNRLSADFSLGYMLSSALEVKNRQIPSDLASWVMGTARQ